VGNGEVVASIPLQGDRTSVSTTVRIAALRSGWYLLRTRGDGPAYPILDVYPYATTSPIYVTVGNQPVRSPADARYFVAWIDRLRAAAEANQDWNSLQEKSRVLEQIGQARAEFERRKAP
jgi:TolB protein